MEKLLEMEKKPEQSTNWAQIVDKSAVFIKGIILLILVICGFLIYTYDRSFRG